MKIETHEIVPFDLYFATLVGMHEHPGYNREGMNKPTLMDDGEMAARMITVRRQLLPFTDPTAQQESNNQLSFDFGVAQ